MTSKLQHITWGLLVMLLIFSASCSKKEEQYAFSGVVVNTQGEPVAGARVDIFPTPEDWMTGHNKIKTLTTDANGTYQSLDIYDAGDYYVFVKKADSTNWSVSDIDAGNFPKVTLPQSNPSHRSVIDYTSMSVIANTTWKLVNVMQEYSKPGSAVKEWQNVWNSVNNCMKDNEIIFDNTTKFLKSEGQYVCRSADENNLVRFIPPLILSQLSCINLPYTGVLVKEMDYFDWPEFENRDGHIYMGCDRAAGQLFLYYLNENNQRTLEVYSRF